MDPLLVFGEGSTYNGTATMQVNDEKSKRLVSRCQFLVIVTMGNSMTPERFNGWQKLKESLRLNSLNP